MEIDEIDTKLRRAKLSLTNAERAIKAAIHKTPRDPFLLKALREVKNAESNIRRARTELME